MYIYILNDIEKILQKTLGKKRKAKKTIEIKQLHKA